MTLGGVEAGEDYLLIFGQLSVSSPILGDGALPERGSTALYPRCIMNLVRHARSRQPEDAVLSGVLEDFRPIDDPIPLVLGRAELSNVEITMFEENPELANKIHVSDGTIPCGYHLIVQRGVADVPLF